MTQIKTSRLLTLSFAGLLVLAACAPASETTQEDDDTTSDDDPASGDEKDAGKPQVRDASKPTTRDARSEDDERDDEDDEGEGDDDAAPRDAGMTSVKPDASTGADAGDRAPSGEKSLLPFKEGNTWTYRVTGGTGLQTKITTVGPMEAVGGTGPNKDKMAFKVTTTKGAMDRTVSWQAVVGASVLRYREVAYAAMTGMPELEEHWAPHKIHVHSDAEHTKAGAKWVETFMETKIMTGMPAATSPAADNWSVDGVDVSVTVPAGTFKAVVLVKASPSGQKTYWYVPGVGKVKETGGQTEELLSFKIVP